MATTKATKATTKATAPAAAAPAAPATLAPPARPAPAPKVRHSHCAHCGYAFRALRPYNHCNVPTACAKRMAANVAAGRQPNSMGYAVVAPPARPGQPLRTLAPLPTK